MLFGVVFLIVVVLILFYLIGGGLLEHYKYFKPLKKSLLNPVLQQLFSFKQNKIHFIHETGLGIIMGMIVGFIFYELNYEFYSEHVN